MFLPCSEGDGTMNMTDIVRMTEEAAASWTLHCEHLCRGQRRGFSSWSDQKLTHYLQRDL